MRRFLLILIALPLFFQSCGDNNLKHMTLREKIGQMFIVRPEAFDPEIE